MKKFLILIVLFLSIEACNRKPSQTELKGNETFEAERDVFFNSLKTPDEISALSLPDAIKYDATLLHDPLRYTHYQDNRVKSAANMGIYIADLNYNLIFGATQRNEEYFTAAHELSKAIGIEQGILQFLKQRYDDNLAQNDSIKKVVKELLQNSTISLRDTERERLAGIVIASYQIENLYLSLASIASMPDKLSEQQQTTMHILMDYIMSYRANIEVSYNFLRAMSDPLDPENNPNYPFFDNALREIIVEYEGIDQNKISTLAAEEAKLITATLKVKVEVVRNKIIML
ncbi:MAG: hypothetical protein MUF39_09190 [Cyclobacteriaceae bacterium]|nr:hypothetical protein [Cyclobacteriaceae bacterium]